MTKAEHTSTATLASGASPVDDPIFAAIERHRIAERDFGGVLTEWGKLEKELPKHLRQSDMRSACDIDTIVETDDPRWIAAERARVAASEKEGKCADALLEVRPTTLAGLRSLLRYAELCHAGRDWPDRIASTAAEALEQIVGADATAAKALAARTPGERVEEAGTSEETDASKFGKAYREWFEVCAIEAKLNAGANYPDAVCDRILERIQSAEHRLAVLPAIHPYQLIDKFEVLETMISKRERAGRPADNRHMLMLMSVKADLYQFEDRFEPRRED
jgi:hypothetical protein